MRGVHVSTERSTVLGKGGSMGTSDFARDVFEIVLSKYEAYGERLTGLAAHRHSNIGLRIDKHCNHRFEHFAGTAPRVFGRGEG
jgi:hypothetical protein